MTPTFIYMGAAGPCTLGMTAVYLSDNDPTSEQKKGRLPKQTPFKLTAPTTD